MFAFLLYVGIVFKVWHFYLMIGISVLCWALLLYAGHFYFMSGISIVLHFYLMFGISVICWAFLRLCWALNSINSIRSNY
jgi:hypothetical protein